MRRCSLSLIGIILAWCLPTIADAKAWRSIVPLKSTRAAVERLLGPPGKDGLYHFDEERAEISYAGNGPCHPVNTCLCFVSETTVISVYVELELEMKFSTLKIDKTKFKKFTSPQNPIIATYSSAEEGIIYTVDHDRDEVIAIEYLPTAKDCNEMTKARKRLLKKSLRKRASTNSMGNKFDMRNFSSKGNQPLRQSGIYSPVANVSFGPHRGPQTGVASRFASAYSLV